VNTTHTIDRKNDFWKSYAVTTFTGTYDSRKRQPGTSYAQLSMGALCELITSPACKEKHAAPAILQSSYNANDARTHNVQRTLGQYVVLCGDVDTGGHSLDAIKAAITDSLGSDIAYGIYSSAGATIENPKWRFFIPLDKPYGYQEWELMHFALEHLLGERGIVLDMAMARAGQPVFLPNVPPTRRTKDGDPVFYQFALRDGRALAASDEGIYTYIEFENASREKMEAIKQLHKEESRRRSDSRRTSGALSTIEAWNRAHSISESFQSWGYTQKGDSGYWRGPQQTSTSYAFADCGEYWVSFSETAKSSQLGSVSQSGIAFGDAFDLYVFHEHRNDINSALRAAGAELTVIDAKTGEVQTLNRAWRLQQMEANANPLLKPEDGLEGAQALTDLERIAVGTQTQDAIALVFRNRFQGKLLYVHSRGVWMEYDGKRWIIDPLLKPFEYVRVIAREANAGNSKDLARSTFFAGVEKICRTDPAFAVSGSDFDIDHLLLNTPAGVVDLRTGQLNQHTPEQMLTKITTVAPDTTPAFLFESTLLEICNGDKSLVEFHQISLGAMLSGAREQHWLLFWYGVGRNGKSLLADLVCDILGDYAVKLPSSILMSSRSEAHPTEVASLLGMRVALSSEVPEDAHWNESRIKELTGDGTLSARFMHQDYFQFPRSHKHLVLGNFRPQLRSTDIAIYARMKMVPFNVSFANREDPDLPAKLREERGSILQWLIEGHIKWFRNGKKLPACAAVEQAGEEYASVQSTVKLWIEERGIKCADIDSSASVRSYPTAAELYADYSEWKRARGESPISMQRWGEYMTKHFERRKSSGLVRYVGTYLPPSISPFPTIDRRW
jgi:putative DNA primase/helicase